MNSDPNEGLEAFVYAFFSSREAEIEKKPECLDVLVPRELADRIGIPPFCSLTIGRHVPDEYGVHYGSPLLEKLAGMACEEVPLTIVRLAYHYVKSQGFERLMDQRFSFHDAIVETKSTASVQTEYLSLTCHYLAQSDEQKEGLVSLTFNLETGAPVGNLETNLDAVEKSFVTGRQDAVFDDATMARINQWVQHRASSVLEWHIEPFRESMNRRYRRDVTNLEEYYADLKNEMTENLMRAGLSPALIEERKAKIDLIPEELAKKKTDLFNKYSIRVELGLSGVMLIRTPAIKLFCQANIGRRRKQLTLFYNPIDKSIDPLVCEGCGAGTFQIHFCDRLHLLCPQCGQRCPVCSK